MVTITFVNAKYYRLHHDMGMKSVEDPFNMGMFFYLRHPSYIMGTFSDPQHTHLGILY